MARGERPVWLGLIRVGGYRAWSRGGGSEEPETVEVSQDVVYRRGEEDWEGEGVGEGAGGEGEGDGAGEGEGEGEEGGNRRERSRRGSRRERRRS